MFRFAIVCDDKRLADTLRALTGLATIVEGPQPVVNAKLRKGRLSAESNGQAVELFEQYLRKEKLDTITGRNAKAFLQSIGREPSSSSYLMKESAKAGLLQKLRSGPPASGGSVYTVRSRSAKQGKQQRKTTKKKTRATPRKKKTAPAAAAEA